MSLQARLTLWSVSVMTLLVGVISVLDLTDEINRQFDSTLARASLVRKLTVAPRPTASTCVEGKL